MLGPCERFALRPVAMLQALHSLSDVGALPDGEHKPCLRAKASRAALPTWPNRTCSRFHCSPVRLGARPTGATTALPSGSACRLSRLRPAGAPTCQLSVRRRCSRWLVLRTRPSLGSAQGLSTGKGYTNAGKGYTNDTIVSAHLEVVLAIIYR